MPPLATQINPLALSFALHSYTQILIVLFVPSVQNPFLDY